VPWSARFSIHGEGAEIVKRKSNGNRRSWTILAAAAAGVLPAMAAAQTTDWIDGSSNWSNPANWDNGVPNTGYTVNITDSDSISRTIIYDYISAATLGSLTVDNIGSGTNTLSLDATDSDDLSASEETIGNQGQGAIVQSGFSVNSISGSLILGNYADASGTYSLSGDAGLAANVEFIGADGHGTFNQSGGGNTISFTLGIAAFPGTTGNYSISGGSATLIGVNASAYVGGYSGGSGGAGTLTVSGTGILTVPGTLQVYAGSSVVNLNGGTINAGAFNFNDNFNQFHWTSGTLNLTGTAFNVVVDSASAGDANFGSFFTLQNGQTLSVAGAEEIGNIGTGSFIQTGGSNSSAGGLVLGTETGSSGNYLLSGGTLSSTGVFYIADAGQGMVTQSGGSMNAPDGIYIGYNPGVSGTYTMSNGSQTIAGGNTLGLPVEFIGGFGAGTFNQSGGTYAAYGDVWVAVITGSAGSYNLSGGSAYVGGDLVIGGNGNSTLDSIIAAPGGTGSLNVSETSGSTILTVTGTLAVFPGSTATLDYGKIQAGALNLYGDYADFSWGVGTLEITNTDLDIDSSVTGPTNPLGPNVTISNTQTFIVDGNETIGGGGGGSLTVNGTHVVGGTVFLEPNGTLTVSSFADFSFSAFIQVGGQINGTFTNNGTYTYEGGLFNGRLINGSEVDLGNDFTAGNGIENDEQMSVEPGQQLIVNGLGLDNFGSFDVYGGTIGGSGPVTNDYGGTLFATDGTIYQSLTNNGTIVVSGGLALTGGDNYGQIILDENGNIRPALGAAFLFNDAGGVIIGDSGAITMNFDNAAGGKIEVPAGGSLAISHAWSNGGLVSMMGVGAELSGGTITNTATIEGAGEVANTVLNSGVIDAAGGELDLAGAGNTNASGSQLQASGGGTLVFIQGLATNSGIIALSGGTFDNDNFTMTNAAGAYIEGFGALKTGGLTNSGIMNVGGNFSVFGSVANSSGAQINATGSGSNLFYGPVTNSGSIGVAPGANITFYNSFTGTTPVNNNGTVTFNARSSSGPITGAGGLMVGYTSPASVQLIANGGSSSQTSLTITPGSTLDLTNNSFLVHYGAAADPISAIKSYLAGGYNGGAWNGVGIISSSVAGLNASQSKLIYSIGYADGSDGITGVPSGEIEIMPTLTGDAKMQGNVVFGDFQLLSQYFGQTGTSWDEGNFSYGSSTNFGDFQLLSQNFGANASALTAGELASLAGFAAEFGDQIQPNPSGVGFSLVAVPEPTSAVPALFIMGGVLIPRRRRVFQRVRRVNLPSAEFGVS
jgi:hypothetical protein